MIGVAPAFSARLPGDPGSWGVEKKEGGRSAEGHARYPGAPAGERHRGWGSAKAVEGLTAPGPRVLDPGAGPRAPAEPHLGAPCCATCSSAATDELVRGLLGWGHLNSSDLLFGFNSSVAALSKACCPPESFSQR